MVYNIKSHKTIYRGIEFRSRLEARWAAMFDLISTRRLEWEYEPIDLVYWTPDFSLKWPCCHSECQPKGYHQILVEVKPYYNIAAFTGHQCTKYPYGFNDNGTTIPADASAAFGINPFVTQWEMAHGCGGGIDTFEMWFGDDDLKSLWEKAGNITRYNPKGVANVTT